MSHIGGGNSRAALRLKAMENLTDLSPDDLTFHKWHISTWQEEDHVEAYIMPVIAPNFGDCTNEAFVIQKLIVLGEDSP